MNKRVLKICWSSWQNESRDKRELSACRELGLDSMVMTEGDHSDWFRQDEVAGFPVCRFSTRPSKKLVPSKRLVPYRVDRFVSVFTWAWCARKLKPMAISGHDIRGLAIGWLSTIGLPKERKPVLIYDSHEFELGRNAKRSNVSCFL